MRLLIREGQPAATAQAVLNGATGDARHEFWPDDAGYADVPIQGINRHRQVTGAYLAQLAGARGSRLVLVKVRLPIGDLPEVVSRIRRDR